MADPNQTSDTAAIDKIRAIIADLPLYQRVGVLQYVLNSETRGVGSIRPDDCAQGLNPLQQFVSWKNAKQREHLANS